MSFINCGVTGQGMQIFLNACYNLTQFNSLTTVNREIGINATTSLKRLVQRPNCLQTLKLKDVKVNKFTSEQMFKIFAQRCSLKSLSLVNYHFTERTFYNFTLYFEFNTDLRMLDVSGALGLRPFWYVNFLKVWVTIRHLRVLILPEIILLKTRLRALSN